MSCRCLSVPGISGLVAAARRETIASLFGPKKLIPLERMSTCAEQSAFSSGRFSSKPLPLVLDLSVLQYSVVCNSQKTHKVLVKDASEKLSPGCILPYDKYS